MLICTAYPNSPNFLFHPNTVNVSFISIVYFPFLSLPYFTQKYIMQHSKKFTRTGECEEPFQGNIQILTHNDIHTGARERLSTVNTKL